MFFFYSFVIAHNARYTRARARHFMKAHEKRYTLYCPSLNTGLTSGWLCAM